MGTISWTCIILGEMVYSDTVIDLMIIMKRIKVSHGLMVIGAVGVRGLLYHGHSM